VELSAQYAAMAEARIRDELPNYVAELAEALDRRQFLNAVKGRRRAALFSFAAVHQTTKSDYS
jgi:hypothetical protein